MHRTTTPSELRSINFIKQWVSMSHYDGYSKELFDQAKSILDNIKIDTEIILSSDEYKTINADIKKNTHKVPDLRKVIDLYSLAIKLYDAQLTDDPENDYINFLDCRCRVYALLEEWDLAKNDMRAILEICNSKQLKNDSYFACYRIMSLFTLAVLNIKIGQDDRYKPQMITKSFSNCQETMSIVEQLFIGKSSLSEDHREFIDQYIPRLRKYKKILLDSSHKCTSKIDTAKMNSDISFHIAKMTKAINELPPVRAEIKSDSNPLPEDKEDVSETLANALNSASIQSLPAIISIQEKSPSSAHPESSLAESILSPLLEKTQPSTQADDESADFLRKETIAHLMGIPVHEVDEKSTLSSEMQEKANFLIDLLIKGQKSFVNEQWPEAIQCTTEVLEQAEHHRALFMRGHAYFEENNYTEAIKDFDHLLMSNTHIYKLHSLLERARSHLKLSHYAQASEDFLALMELDIEFELFWKKTEIAMNIIQSYTECEYYLFNITSIKPLNFNPTQKNKIPEKAINDWLLLACQLIQRHRFEHSLALFWNVIQCTPAMKSALNTLKMTMDSFVTANDFKKAADLLFGTLRHFRKTPTKHDSVMNAKLSFDAHKFLDAFKYFTQALQFDPYCPELYLDRSICTLLNDCNYPNALKDINAAIWVALVRVNTMSYQDNFFIIKGHWLRCLVYMLMGDENKSRKDLDFLISFMHNLVVIQDESEAELPSILDGLIEQPIKNNQLSVAALHFYDIFRPHRFSLLSSDDLTKLPEYCKLLYDTLSAAFHSPSVDEVISFVAISEPAPRIDSPQTVEEHKLIELPDIEKQPKTTPCPAEPGGNIAVSPALDDSTPLTKNEASVPEDQHVAEERVATEEPPVVVSPPRQHNPRNPRTRKNGRPTKKQKRLAKQNSKINEPTLLESDSPTENDSSDSSSSQDQTFSTGKKSPQSTLSSFASAFIPSSESPPVKRLSNAVFFNHAFIHPSVYIRKTAHPLPRMPEEVCDIIRGLSVKGDLTFLGGGAIRNTLIGIEVTDYDIRTGADTETILAFGAVRSRHNPQLFKYKKNGLKFDIWQTPHFRRPLWGDPAKREVQHTNATINGFLWDADGNLYAPLDESVEHFNAQLIAEPGGIDSYVMSLPLIDKVIRLLTNLSLEMRLPGFNLSNMLNNVIHKEGILLDYLTHILYHRKEADLDRLNGVMAKFFGYAKSGTYFCTLIYLGVINILFPEISKIFTSVSNTLLSKICHRGAKSLDIAYAYLIFSIAMRHPEFPVEFWKDKMDYSHIKNIIDPIVAHNPLFVCHYRNDPSAIIISINRIIKMWHKNDVTSHVKPFKSNSILVEEVATRYTRISRVD